MPNFNNLNKLGADKLDSVKSKLGLGPEKAMLYIQGPRAAALGAPAIPGKNAQMVGGQTSNALKRAAAEGKSVAAGAVGALGGFNALKVQFNPATLKFRGTSDEVRIRANNGQPEDEMPMQIVRPPSVVLSVELVFDDVSPADCFANTLWNPSLKSAFETASSLVLGTWSHSVMPQTNALIGMLMQIGTRVVCFQWADMLFVGEVTTVDVNYTMFNTQGEPVRSTVALEILQKVEANDAISYWNDAFDRFFGESHTTGDIKANSIGSKVKNIINLPVLK